LHVARHGDGGYGIRYRRPMTDSGRSAKRHWAGSQ
jgi:hypothetical protein